MSDRSRARKTRPSCLSSRFLCRSKVHHSCKTKTLLLKVCEAKPPRCGAGLKGILMAGIEETNVTDTLDEGGVKKLTGTEVVTGRPLFKDFVTFNATMLVRHPRIELLSLELSDFEYPEARRPEGRGESDTREERRLCARSITLREQSSRFRV
jgi:hypothetical protein